MFPLFETMRIRDGKIYNLSWHQQRLEQSCRRYFGKGAGFALSAAISLPENVKKGLFKLRLLYDPDHFETQYEPYTFKKIITLKMIRDDDIEYSLKYTDRIRLEELLEQKGTCDDILIVKNGFVTDTSFTNIVFFDGSNWLTPKTPLLKGTCRDRLIHEKKMVESDIKPEDLNHFTHFKLINAMRDFDGSESERIENILSRIT
jgi:4-amino-4-deoxychorismate lyase